MVVGFIAPWPEHVPLRPWQERARGEYFRRNAKDFLVVATPGAGKTTFALRIAHDLLSTGAVKRIVVVCPTEHLKKQWADAAAKVGIDLDPAWSNRNDGVARDYHGVVVTYHQIASNPDVHRVECRKATLVIFDEIHHAGDGNAWGDTLRHAFDPATRRLSLSGTPFRTGNNPIPYVVYDADGRSSADFTYGYGAALADAVCRPVIFPSYEGNMEWFSGGEVFKASFADDLNESQASERLKTALDTRSAWMNDVLTEAHAKLMELRRNGHPNAGGLVIARDQMHARHIVELLSKRCSCIPALAISDDPNASTIIEAFAKSIEPWIVAVKLVSEGVDIPRLRVGVYATNTATEMFFRQALGRFLRMIEGIDEQSAYLFIPKERVLIEYVQKIKEERNHAIDQAIEDEHTRQGGDDLKPKQEGLYYAISATAKADDVYFDQEALTQAQLDEAKAIAQLIGFAYPTEILARAFVERDRTRPAPQQTTQSARPVEAEPLHERKKRMASIVNNLVRQLSYATNNAMHFSDIWVRLTAYDGVRHTNATLEQHTKRAEVLQRWIKEARDANRQTA